MAIIYSAGRIHPQEIHDEARFIYSSQASAHKTSSADTPFEAPGGHDPLRGHGKDRAARLPPFFRTSRTIPPAATETFSTAGSTERTQGTFLKAAAVECE